MKCTIIESNRAVKKVSNGDPGERRRVRPLEKIDGRCGRIPALPGRKAMVKANTEQRHVEASDAGGLGCTRDLVPRIIITLLGN